MLASLIGKVGSMFGGSSVFKWVGMGVVALVLTAAFCWLGWGKAQAEAERDQVRAELVAVEAAHAASVAALQDLRQTVEAQRQALAERDQAINEINAQRETLRQRWQEAIRHDETVRDWADAPLPDAVRSMLQ